MPRSSKAGPLGAASGAFVLVGAGKMGGALLDGWLAQKLSPKRIVVVDPKPTKAIKALQSRGLRLNPKDNFGPVAALVIAVKPQVAADALERLALMIGSGTVVLSIMAGRRLEFLEAQLPGAAIVRAMPNTPASIGRGITVAVGNRKVKAAAKGLANALLRAGGEVEWITDEALMDAVTAVSGSGPAYAFLLAETMAQAGVAAGLPAPLAERLARVTVAGSGELLHRSDQSAAQLRQNVTSPGGTTAAALEVLMGPNGFGPLLTKAVTAAAARSKALG